MVRSSWKGAERRAAKALGGQRVPVTGRARGNAPDIEGAWYRAEVKAGHVLPARLQLALRQAKASCAGTDKTPIVIIDHVAGPGRPNVRAVLIELSEWVLLHGDTETTRCTCGHSEADHVTGLCEECLSNDGYPACQHAFSSAHAD